jgi:dinuclear metal center YbgI/SA1388 family protein
MMELTVADMIQIIERIAPQALAEDWDNSGLQIGSRSWPVKKVWVALDPSPEVIEAACSQNTQLLITHHPLIFRPIKSIDFSHPLGKSIEMAVKHRLAVFSAHTNLDKTPNGLNDMLAERIGLKNIAPLHQEDGQPSFGRIGELASRGSLRSLAESVKKSLAVEHVRVAGDLALSVASVLVCSGSGSGLLADFLLSEAQVYLSGDLRYHDALEIRQANRGMIDIGHFASEHIMVDALAGRLTAELDTLGATAEVVAYDNEKDPFVLI